LAGDEGSKHRKELIADGFLVLESLLFNFKSLGLDLDDVGEEVSNDCERKLLEIKEFLLNQSFLKLLGGSD
jgi:hypothetical protein